MQDIMSYFPLETPRESQKGVIEAADKIFKDYDVLILEGPVGSGKSAIAETLARAYGDAHILTPRKSLQDQYMDDFRQFGMVTMKGKGAYPCYPGHGVGKGVNQQESDNYYEQTIRVIESGAGRWPTPIEPKNWPGFHSVADGHCMKAGKRVSEKTKRCQVTTIVGDEDAIDPRERGIYHERPCPYVHAIETAQLSPQIVHNLHSFLFQNYYGKFFTERSLLVIDECHELEGIVRDFVSTSFNLPMLKDDIPESGPDLPEDDASIADWVTFLSWHRFVPPETNPEAREKWMEKLLFITDVAETFLEDRVVFWEDNVDKNSTKITFMPENMGQSPANLFFQYGVKVLLMSGTIYDKKYFCKKLGINPDKAAFIRLTSEFPLATRPIVADKRLMTNNSFASWRDDETAYSDMLKNIRTILAKHPDVKGLIHAPSYYVAEDLCRYVRDDRLVTHNQENFQEVLDKFYADEGNKVLVSPICQQGVDFKYDRARFQMVIRVPFLNTSDPFVERMMKRNYSWYNYQSLITFGQMIGRVNRAPDDYGVTYLMDERFIRYLNKNKKLLPAWLMAAIKRT